MKRLTTTLIAALMICLAAHPQDQQRGKATYYSKRATGARTSSGERMHHDSLTCAHRSYPFGTLLRVTNERNGRQVVVRVIDRGPFAKGRIIDLSYAAAKQLGMLQQGVDMVTVEPITNTRIPYKAEPLLMPEIDFKVTEYIVPADGELHLFVDPNPTKDNGGKGSNRTTRKSGKENKGNNTTRRK